MTSLRKRVALLEFKVQLLEDIGKYTSIPEKPVPISEEELFSRTFSGDSENNEMLRERCVETGGTSTNLWKTVQGTPPITGNDSTRSMSRAGRAVRQAMKRSSEIGATFSLPIDREILIEEIATEIKLAAEAARKERSDR